MNMIKALKEQIKNSLLGTQAWNSHRTFSRRGLAKKNSHMMSGGYCKYCVKNGVQRHPGKINISGATYELVKEYFECEYRGKIKNKE